MIMTYVTYPAKKCGMNSLKKREAVTLLDLRCGEEVKNCMGALSFDALPRTLRETIWFKIWSFRLKTVFLWQEK